MKPGEHPDFFRFPAPEGRSRESSIRLDGLGRFWHDGALVEHPAMQRAFAGWIRKHPDDGRYILSNDYDWTYFTVEDVPFFVQGLRIDEGEAGPEVRLFLSDGSEQALEADGLCIGAEGALYCSVKGGEFSARFTPSAQTALAPLLVELEGDDRVGLRLGESIVVPDLRPSSPSAKTGA